jgi:hypothetical protein
VWPTAETNVSVRERYDANLKERMRGWDFTKVRGDAARYESAGTARYVGHQLNEHHQAGAGVRHHGDLADVKFCPGA